MSLRDAFEAARPGFKKNTQWADLLDTEHDMDLVDDLIGLSEAAWAKLQQSSNISVLLFAMDVVRNKDQELQHTKQESRGSISWLNGKKSILNVQCRRFESRRKQFFFFGGGGE